jgi:cell division protein FtsA
MKKGGIMANISADRLCVAIDIGTTKICVLIAHCFDTQSFEIIGIGKAPSEGLSKGVVVDIAKTMRSIKQAVKEAELMAGITVESAYIGVSGGHIHSINSHGMVPIRKGEVRPEEVDAVIAAAQALPIAEGQQILHVLPQYFVIDGQEKVQDPIGMYGIRLEVQVHMITGAVASVQNLVKCCHMAGIKVEDVILEQLASADAVLTADERKLGIGVLDIGGGTSDFALYQHSSIRHTMVLPMAGNHFTNDIAIGLRTTFKEAERIKRSHGIAALNLMKEDDILEIENLQGTEKKLILVRELVDILQPRAYELLSLVHEEVVKENMQSCMRAGLVLTGGGSLLRGMKEVAEEIFRVPVRVGCPRNLIVMSELLQSPMYATAYGLLVHALAQRKEPLTRPNDQFVQRIFDSMKAWVTDFF